MVSCVLHFMWQQHECQLKPETADVMDPDLHVDVALTHQVQIEIICL